MFTHYGPDISMIPVNKASLLRVEVAVLDLRCPCENADVLEILEVETRLGLVDPAFDCAEDLALPLLLPDKY
eukprot:1346554-Amorphochlora_amoeboformis.AAC.1